MVKQAAFVSTAPVDNIHISLMQEMYRAFDFFNAHYKLELDRPIITLVNDTKKKAAGWFSHDIWSAGSESMHEINVCAEQMAQGVNRCMEILVHEMAHLKNFEVAGKKVVDCTDQQRHNKIFSDRAESLGLAVTSSARFGSAHTTLTPELEKLIATKLQPDESVFVLFRKKFNAQKDKKPKGSDKLKPVIVSVETKATIAEQAKALGCSQKDFAGAAVELLAKMPDRIKDATVALLALDVRTTESVEAVLREFFVPNIPKSDEVKP